MWSRPALLAISLFHVIKLNATPMSFAEGNLHMQLLSNSAKLYTFAPKGTRGASGVKVSGAKRQ